MTDPVPYSKAPMAHSAKSPTPQRPVLDQARLHDHQAARFPKTTVSSTPGVPSSSRNSVSLCHSCDRQATIASTETKRVRLFRVPHSSMEACLLPCRPVHPRGLCGSVSISHSTLSNQLRCTCSPPLVRRVKSSKIVPPPALANAASRAPRQWSFSSKSRS